MEICGFEIAKKLKEKGFRELCLAYYTNDNTLYYNYSHKAGACHTDCYFSHNLMPKDSVSGKFVDAPTISQVLKWLREEKKLHITLDVGTSRYWFWIVWNIEADPLDLGIGYEMHQSYELAAVAGIEYVIDNLI